MRLEIDLVAVVPIWNLDKQCATWLDPCRKSGHELTWLRYVLEHMREHDQVELPCGGKCRKIRVRGVVTQPFPQSRKLGPIGFHCDVFVRDADSKHAVMEHLRFASEYRGANTRPYLSISFVVTDQNSHTLDKIKAIAVPLVDEFVAFPALNQSGQLSGSGEKAKPEGAICHTPFNKLHISWEGFLRGCCNDYENLLTIEDINTVSIKDVYYGERYRQWRRQHLEWQARRHALP